MRRTMICTLLCLLTVSVCLEARAEVVVRTDRGGNYIKTQIIQCWCNLMSKRVIATFFSASTLVKFA